MDSSQKIADLYFFFDKFVLVEIYPFSCQLRPFANIGIFQLYHLN